jgi:hypothetical protein
MEIEMFWADEWTDKEDFEVCKMGIVHVLAVYSLGFGLSNFMGDKLD